MPESNDYLKKVIFKVNAKHPKVIIVGAGLSGLACALTLQKNNISYLLFEADSRVGGRVKTDRHESGFLLDRGFQVLLNAYSELDYFVDIKSLNLKKFNSGAILFNKVKNQILANPFRNLSQMIPTAFTDVATLKDKSLVIQLVLKSLLHKQMQPLKGQSTLVFLENYGFSQRFIQFFWKPFLGGIYLDQTLSLEVSYFLFLLRCFGLGSVTLPALGMEELPKQMASNLNSKNVFLSNRISHITKHSVILENGEEIQGDYIVQAYNKDTQHQRSVSTFYFAANEKPDWGKWLVLVPPDLNFKLNHVVLLSEVSSDYAPQGQVLISATVLGDEKIENAVIENEIEFLAQKKLQLKHLRTDLIQAALPFLSGNEKGYLRNDHLYECGDHTSSPSIEGALKAGRLTALDIISDINHKKTL